MFDLGFEANVGGHAQQHQRARLLGTHRKVRNQALGVDVQAMVLRNRGEALNAGVRKRVLHGV